MDSNIARLLREFVRQEMLAEKKKRRKKPGGPRTDLGAEFHLNPEAVKTKIQATVKSTKGDVAAAANSLDVAERTLYHYLETVPGLENVKTTEDYQLEDEEEAAAAEKRAAARAARG